MAVIVEPKLPFDQANRGILKYPHNNLKPELKLEISCSTLNVWNYKKNSTNENDKKILKRRGQIHAFSPKSQMGYKMLKK